MTTRRTFIMTLAAMPPLLKFGCSWAANDPSQLALIIGNSSYRDAPLVNPANDAKAVSGLFTEAGFTVDLRLNANRVDMVAAIERFGAAVKRSETKLVVFYYAGHGAQLDWRNYLLPVDAVVEKPEDMKQRCVDLGLLLGQFGAAKDKTFVVILDACRNNPFGRSYRPEQKGLSQFDAPVGSLLAYATSPGNVASDGEGANGLYTENLVRELSKRNTRIEDALKRVRLSVRLASHGAQVPWETTSLEGDVFIFNEGRKTLTEAEQEKLLEADFGEWGRIKSSKKIDDWVTYLRTFPNGRFAEIAQMRLTRLLAEDEKLTADKRQREEQQRLEQQRIELEPNPTPSPLAKPAAEAAPASAAPMIDIKPGVAVPTFIAPSANPYSAGRYPLSRIFTVGDSATFRISDILTGVEERTSTLRVTRVSYDEDLVEFNQGYVIVDLMGNLIKAGPFVFEAPRQWSPMEFQVGKKWTAAYRLTNNGVFSAGYYGMRIVKREPVSVPAGRFDAFRIEGNGWDTTFGNRLEVKLWMVPGLNFTIKAERMERDKGARLYVTERTELVALRQQTIDTKCTTPTGGLHRTLIIKSNCG